VPYFALIIKYIRTTDIDCLGYRGAHQTSLHPR
jgi:hypothetical protein